MLGWGSRSRGLPRSRRDMLAAYSVLAQDTVAARGELGRSRLDVISLGATAQVLAGEVGRLRHELNQLHVEMTDLRASTSAQSDQLVMMLMRQSAELRSQLAESQRSVAELAARMADFAERAERVEPPSTRSVLPPVQAEPLDVPATDGAVVTDLRDATRAPDERLRLIRHALGG